MKDGQVVKEIPTEVLNPAIASPKTIQEIQVILEKVVSEGLGRQAGSKQFHVSGKTGTAQVSQGKSGYTNGMRQYLVSFCGYFPSESPRYSCIVAIQKNAIRIGRRYGRPCIPQYCRACVCKTSCSGLTRCERFNFYLSS